MTRKAITSVLLLFMALAVANIALGEVENFKLVDGTSIKGEVKYVDTKGIMLNRWIGSLGTDKKEEFFPWDKVMASLAVELKAKYGVPLVDNTAIPWYIGPGKRIKIGNTVLEGWVDEEASSPNTLVMNLKGKLIRPIQRTMIESQEDITLDLRECLKPNKLYRLLLSKGYPISARDHFKMARLCEEIGALKDAAVHYKKAMELDERYFTNSGSKIEELASKFNEQFALQLLEKAKDALARKKTKEAAGYINQIIENYPTTAAAVEAQKLMEKIQDKLNLEVAEGVVDDYYKLLRSIILERVSGKVLDGPSKPGFRVSLDNGNVIDGELCDENGALIPPPPPEDLEFEKKEELVESDEFIYVKDKRGVVEIPRRHVKKMEPIELNKVTKKAEFTVDHRTYLMGKDSELHREVRRRLSFKYGIPDRDIKDMWSKRALEIRDYTGKILRKSFGREINVRYTRGTYFSPRLKNEKGLKQQFPLQDMDDNKYFDALPRDVQGETLFGIMAEYSLELVEGSAQVSDCPICKGTGKSADQPAKTTAPNNPNNPNPPANGPGTKGYGCTTCHGVGSWLTFRCK
ncbi:MAG: hypothetical protein WC712_03620 [Candidatus Brocadiia bacterium]